MTSVGPKELYQVTYTLPDYVYMKTVDKAAIKMAGWDGSKWSILPT